jgi:hypothetical protein
VLALEEVSALAGSGVTAATRTLTAMPSLDIPTYHS